MKKYSADILPGLSTNNDNLNMLHRAYDNIDHYIMNMLHDNVSTADPIEIKCYTKLRLKLRETLDAIEDIEANRCYYYDD